MGSMATTHDPRAITVSTSLPPGIPGGGGAGSPDMAALIRDIMRRKQMEAEQKRQQEARAREMQEAAAEQDLEERRQAQKMALEREGRATQAETEDRVYQNRLRQIDLAPPQKLIESRPGVIGGYMQDVTMLPLSMRPKSSGFERGGASLDELRGPGPALNDQVSASRLAAINLGGGSAPNPIESARVTGSMRRSEADDERRAIAAGQRRVLLGQYGSGR